MRDVAPSTLSIVIRPRGRASDLAGPLDVLARSIGPRVVVDGMKTGPTLLDNRVSFHAPRVALAASAGFIGLAMALIGIFAVTAYAVSRRVREIGVRMALGATPGNVTRQIVLDSLSPAMIGILTGVAVAWMATRVISSMLFNTTPTDPLTFVLVAATLCVGACLAAYLPARRAARIDPMAAVRSE